jgi:RNA polymerase sigma factor (sigma-70 family)
MAMTDAELLEASRRGELRAFGLLVERYQRVVAAVSYSRTRDHALSEDVAQETFLVAWQMLDRLREPASLRAWLCGIARNLARKARRRGEREVFDAEVSAAELCAGDDPFAAACAAEAEHVVREALGRVPETYRDALVLYYREQLSVREVAEALGISEAAALQRLSRGRHHLARGATDLVERALRGQPPRRDLARRVLAALPVASPLAPSRVEASNHHGGSMLKLFAGAVLVAGTLTTVLVIAPAARGPASADDAAPATSSIAALGPAVAHPAPTTSDPPGAAAPVPAAKPPPRLAPADPARVILDHSVIERLALERGPSRGAADAPITITMFTDLQCEFCSRAHGTIDQLFDEYPGKLRLVIKQLPVHRKAELAAEAAHAAEAQGKFWELDELMIANPEDLSRDAILALARQGGLDVTRLAADLDAHAFAGAVAADRAAAAELELRGTPSFVIAGRKLQGAYPVETFRQLIDDALAAR